MPDPGRGGNYWNRLISETVAETLRLIDQYEDEFLNSVWPSLVEAVTPEERLAWYNKIDWQVLKDTAPKLWLRYSGDAIDLMRQRAVAEQKALVDYEQQQFTESKAFLPQVQPFGYKPTALDPYVLGLSRPLPLGQATS